MEIVSLDDMNGFEFQRFVAHLYERLGFGTAKEILDVGDSGRDIVIQSINGGLIVIECKHHPKGIIGRPVVQKLHSAVLTANAKKGYVVTTGRFSTDALNYAKEIGGLIELVDSRILYDMASKANIKLLREGEKTSVYYIIPPSRELIIGQIIAHIIGNALSQPYLPVQLAEINITRFHFEPVYLLEYNLHEDFSTSIGVIHKIHIAQGRILINAQNGELINPQLEKIVTPQFFSENLHTEEYTNVSSGRFIIGYTSAKETGLKHIQRLHTQIVKYRGGNNVLYTKKCTPHVSRILIRSLTQVYLPTLTGSCKILTRSHRISLCGNQSQIEILGSDAGTCEICGRNLGDDRLLCNSCGKIVHKPSFMGHSYYCGVCGKTLCRECTLFKRKYLFYKKKLCHDCAKKLENKT